MSTTSKSIRDVTLILVTLFVGVPALYTFFTGKKSLVDNDTPEAITKVIHDTIVVNNQTANITSPEKDIIKTAAVTEPAENSADKKMPVQDVAYTESVQKKCDCPQGHSYMKVSTEPAKRPEQFMAYHPSDEQKPGTMRVETSTGHLWTKQKTARNNNNTINITNAGQYTGVQIINSLLGNNNNNVIVLDGYPIGQ